MTSATVSQKLARQIEASRPGTSEEAIAAARHGLLDYMAVAIAGCRDSSARRLRSLFATRSMCEASVIGSIELVDILDAALLNGYSAHVLDYDDQHGPARGHPSTVILPALLATCEAYRCAPVRLLEAYVIGVEVMARLGIALGASHYEQGFHQTATIGTIAAAAAVAYLLELDAPAIENALAFAVSQAGGLRFQFASEGKPLHAGLAARAGTLAARLAAGGMQAGEGCLDGDGGFFRAYGGSTAEPERCVQGWAQPWQIVRPGLLFKAWPCCVAAHYAAEASLRLKERYEFRQSEIEAVSVRFPVGGDLPLQVRSPRTGVEGRFSVEYVVAVALSEGRLGLSDFSDAPIRPDLPALIKRVSRRYDHDLPRASSDPTARYSVVELTLVDGKVYEERCDKLPAASDLRSKFVDAVQGDVRLELIPELSLTITCLEDFHRITQICRHADLPNGVRV